jgi:hypothetical protein
VRGSGLVAADEEEAEALAALASFEADEAVDNADALASTGADGTDSSSAVRAALAAAEEAVSGDQDDDVDAEMLALTAGMLPFSQEAPDFGATAQQIAKAPAGSAVKASGSVLHASDASNDSPVANAPPGERGSGSHRPSSAASGASDATSVSAAERAAQNRAKALQLRQQRQRART